MNGKTLKQMDIEELEELLDTLENEAVLELVEREIQERNKPTVHHEQDEKEDDDE